MCVILIANKTRVPEWMASAAWEANPEGGGIAWREGKEVKWKKGLGKDEIIQLVSEVPLPFIAHFRIASCGGKRPELTHPFTLDNRASIDLSGSTRGCVMFHNGHYTNWKDLAINIAAKTGKALPPGAWSDTRVMAWVGGVLGQGILDMLDEKTVVFGPEIFQIYSYPRWSWIDGILCSNTIFDSKHYKKGYYTSAPASLGGDVKSKECKANGCKVLLVNTSADYCAQHQPKEVGGSTTSAPFPAKGLEPPLRSPQDTSSVRQAVASGVGKVLGKKALRRIRRREAKQEKAKIKEMIASSPKDPAEIMAEVVATSPRLLN